MADKTYAAIKFQVADFTRATLPLTERQVKTLCENSIERAINQAIEDLQRNKRPSVAEQDLIELKFLMVRVWGCAQNACIAQANGLKD